MGAIIEGTTDHAYDERVDVDIQGIPFYASNFFHLEHTGYDAVLSDKDQAAVFMHIGRGLVCIGHIERYKHGYRAGKWRAGDWRWFDHRGSDDGITGAIESLLYYEKRNKGRDVIRMAHGDEPYRGR